MAFPQKQQNKLIDFIDSQALNIEYETPASWSNFCSTVTPEDITLLKVHDLDSAQKLFKKINEMNSLKDPEYRITCRIAAGGKENEAYSNSFSLTPWISKLNNEGADIPQTDIIMNLNFDPELIKPVEIVDKTTVKVRPGVQIKELDEFLFNNGLQTKCPGSLINRVTSVGLAALGGHGAHMEYGGYSDNIKSLTFLQMDGTLKKIVRKTSSEKSQHPSAEYLKKEKLDYYEELEPDEFDLIASAHLGVFGAVVEMELECKPATKLECVETPMSLPKFLEKMKKGKLPRKEYPMFSVFYTPTMDNDLTNREIKNVKVMEYRDVPLTAEDLNFNEDELLARRIQQALEVELEGGFRVTDLLALFPQLGPAYMRYIVARFAIGTEKKISVGSAPYRYHYQEFYPKDINDVDAMFAVSEDYHEMIAAFIKVAEETQAAKDRGEDPVTFGAYARLVKNMKYKFSLAPGSHHSDKDMVCGFDVVSSPGAVGFEAFRDNLIDFLIQEFEAKLHWGKYIPLDKGIDYNHMYQGDLEKFNSVLKSWHRKSHLDMSRSPFLTPFPCQILGLNQFMPAVQYKIPAANDSFIPQIIFDFFAAFVAFIEELQAHQTRTERKSRVVPQSVLTGKDHLAISRALTDFVEQMNGHEVTEPHESKKQEVIKCIEEVHAEHLKSKSVPQQRCGFFSHPGSTRENADFRTSTPSVVY